MTRSTIAIVGAGLAGAKAAQAAREAGYAGRVVLVGDEPMPPYERPPLSKSVLRGDAAPSSAAVHPPGFYDEHDIELVHREVAAIDTVARRLVFSAGEDLTFDTAVLAMGAAPRPLPLPGVDLPGVFSLRTIDDAVALGAALRQAERVAVVGSGWIGSEVAASARQMGADVVLIDPSPFPLQRVLGDRMGAVFAGLHAENGVTLRLARGVTAVRGHDRVEGVVLDGGQVEQADVVVVGIGVVPRVQLAESALGLRVDNGVVADQHLETSVPGIFAAGDVANAWHPFYGRRLRVEHWANAVHQGEVAGRNAAGAREVYDRLPYFFSDQYDLGMEYVGHGSPDDEVVVRGDLDGRKFIAFWQRDGVVTAAMNVNVWDVADDLTAIVRSGRPFDPAVLADEGVLLADVLGPAHTG